MVLVTSVIIVRQDAFNGATILRNQAYEVALDVRQVQLQAVSASNLSGSFREVYGLRFDASSDNYRIFQDSDDNKEYDSSEEYGPQGFLDKRFEIKEIKTVDGASINIYSDPVNVFFRRPNFDASFFNDTNGTELASSISAIQIVVAVKGSGLIRTVEISKAGQITVN
jgi:hypothetical protein